MPPPRTTVDPTEVERFTDGDADERRAKLYKRYCGGCHGADGRGGAQTFMPHIQNLTQKDYIEFLPDGYLFTVIAEGGGLGRQEQHDAGVEGDAVRAGHQGHHRPHPISSNVLASKGRRGAESQGVPDEESRGGPMKLWSALTLSASALALTAPLAIADMQGTAESGGWETRVAVKRGSVQSRRAGRLQGERLRRGLGAPSSATVDGDGNVWVAVAPPLLGSPQKDQFEDAHVKVFDPQGKLIKEIGKGTFTSNVMNEMSYCPENGKVYIPEYQEKIWEIDGVDGELKLIIKDLFLGDHKNGGITCKDGYIYFALGLPSNTGFADPDNHGWTDVPNDPFWVDPRHRELGQDPARSAVPRHRAHRAECAFERRPPDRRLVARRRAGRARHEDPGQGALRRLGHAGQDGRRG